MDSQGVGGEIPHKENTQKESVEHLHRDNYK